MSERKRQKFDHTTTSIDDLGSDVKTLIFSYLDWPEILRGHFCRKWAVDTTTQGLAAFPISSPQHYDAVAWVACVFPNLQQISLTRLPWNYRYQNGEEPVEEDAQRRPGNIFDDNNEDVADPVELDSGIFSRFRKLQHLDIQGVLMNGVYTHLSNFSCLRKLNIRGMQYMKWDLAMLSGMPMLEELACSYCGRLSGNVKSLRVVKETLRSVHIGGGDCTVTGDLMELADFPSLEMLRLQDTLVTGDVRNLREDHFPMLRDISLPSSVYGGRTFERISDVPEIMAALSCLQKRTPELFRTYDWSLSESSPDYYRMNHVPESRAPFHVHFVTAGPRLGWRWSSGCHFAGSHWVQHCEIHWLDPKPSKEENPMEAFHYDRDVQSLEYCVQRYKGFFEPPSETQYQELINGASGLRFPLIQRGYYGWVKNW